MGQRACKTFAALNAAAAAAGLAPHLAAALFACRRLAETVRVAAVGATYTSDATPFSAVCPCGSHLTSIGFKFCGWAKPGIQDMMALLCNYTNSTLQALKWKANPTDPCGDMPVWDRSDPLLTFDPVGYLGIEKVYANQRIYQLIIDRAQFGPLEVASDPWKSEDLKGDAWCPAGALMVGVHGMFGGGFITSLGVTCRAAVP